jgi:methylamine---glutamate N-methyltransferase subunit C
LHRGALLADASVRGDDIVCGVHGWDFQYRTGISAYNPTERLHRFSAWIEDGGVWIDLDEVDTFLVDNPQPYDRDSYQGAYQDFSGTSVEPHVKAIREMASHGLDRLGHHGAMGAMGVPADELPKWDDIQIVTAQLARPPLLDDEAVDTSVVIGGRAAKPLELDIPLFVSDMSFGSLSREAKVSLARGAELAGTGICSGEGGMLADEQAANSRYFYELASSRFGFSWDKVTRAQAFHFKGGQAAKTGTGGHLPGNKVTAEIAEVRGLEPGQDAISPSRFPEWTTPAEIAVFADEVRDRTGGIPIGYKLSAQHVEDDLEAALDVGVDYVIVDGRGGATGAAPLLFRDNISVPTIPALARARRFLDENAPDVTLVITGGLRTPADFVKALALGADAIALANAPLQAIGCLGMRACNTNNCPVGIATQQEHLRDRLPTDEAAQRLHRYFEATVELMKLLARACGHGTLSDFSVADLTTWKPDMAALSGIPFGGVGGTVS